MAEPISLTLAAAAFVEPAIRATYHAYSLLRLSRSFGPDFKECCRKLDGQKARLEEWSNWPVGTLLYDENDTLAKVVVAELAAMQDNLAKCAAIRSKYEFDPQASMKDNETPTDYREKPLPRKGSSADKESKRKVHSDIDSETTAHRSDSSVSFSTMSNESNETAITSIHDSFLKPKPIRSYSDAVIQDVSEKQRIDAKRMQSSASLRQRAMWVARDREEYKTFIKAITNSNDLIEGLVRTRALKCLNSVTANELKGNKEIHHNGRIMPAVDRLVVPPLPAEDRSCIKVIARLHGALLQSRKSKEGEGMAKSQFGFKASLDHSLTKENLLTEFEELSFRTDSQVYLLQAWKPTKAGESTLLLAESPDEPSPAQTTPQVPVNDFDPFVHVGDFSATPYDTHRFYRDVTSWISVTTLHDLIGSTKKAPSPAFRFRLAALLATTHLHSTGLSYTPGQLNPGNFKYFDTSTEAESFSAGELLEDEDRLLSLYYFSGIGSVRPKNSTRSIGALRGATPTFDASTTELGLLLYQIGSWHRLDYGNVSSAATLERLRRAVKQRVHELHREAGIRYAETVETCLEWRQKPAKEREAELPRLYQEVIKSLKDLDEEFSRVFLLNRPFVETPSDAQRTRKNRSEAKKNMEDTENNPEAFQNVKGPNLLDELSALQRSHEEIIANHRQMQADLARISSTFDQLMNINAPIRTTDTYLDIRSRDLKTQQQRGLAIIRTIKAVAYDAAADSLLYVLEEATDVRRFRKLYVLGPGEVDELHRRNDSISLWVLNRRATRYANVQGGGVPDVVEHAFRRFLDRLENNWGLRPFDDKTSGLTLAYWAFMHADDENP